MLAHDPGGGVKIPIALICFIDISVLADLIDLIGQNIRALVALGAGVGLTGHFHGKTVAHVTGGAGSEAFIRIDPAHALIGPSRQQGELHLAEIRFPHHRSLDFDFGSVTRQTRGGIGILVRGFQLQTSLFQGINAVNHPYKIVIEGVFGQVAISPGHFVLEVLSAFHRMTGGAIPRRHHRVDLLALMFKGVEVQFRAQGVTFRATDRDFGQTVGNGLGRYFPAGFRPFHCFGRTDLGMSALFPIGYNRRSNHVMTVEAGLGGVADPDFRPDRRSPGNQSDYQNQQ